MKKQCTTCFQAQDLTCFGKDSRNKEGYARRAATRRAVKHNATPAWLSEDDKFAIELIYAISRSMGSEYEVDHVIPLKASNRNREQIACGLHVPWNLRIINAKENREKNCFYGDE